MGAGARSSQRMKADRRPANRTNDRIIAGLSNPRIEAQVRLWRKVMSVAVESAAPGQSNFWPRAEPLSDLSASMNRNAETRPAAAIMEVAKKTHSHPSAPTMNPPTAGPATFPVPTTLIWSPSALPLSSFGKLAISIAMEVPWVIAEPMPWASLAAIREPMFGAKPAATPMAMRITVPSRYIFFLPTMSASLPIGSRNALIVSAYPITTHWLVGRSVLKCSAIVGSATPTLP